MNKGTPGNPDRIEKDLTGKFGERPEQAHKVMVDRASYLAGLERMASSPLQDRHNAAERYMTLLGPRPGFLDYTADSDPVVTDDFDRIRQLVTRLLKAGLLDLANLIPKKSHDRPRP